MEGQNRELFELEEYRNGMVSIVIMADLKSGFVVWMMGIGDSGKGDKKCEMV